jgi:hypothetical protein
LGATGIFIGYELLICANDDEAIKKAKRHIDLAHEIELFKPL